MREFFKTQLIASIQNEINCIQNEIHRIEKDINVIHIENKHESESLKLLQAKKSRLELKLGQI